MKYIYKKLLIYSFFMFSICHSYAELNNQIYILELQKQIKELQTEINHFEETKI
ncbi:DUF3573 domain-containing protein, partial [Francisella tularensis]|uniref:DUF3573 domain-containing protein n=1 Tax=Francisella tularensis TaxID=263 RepID=UPI002381ACF6